MIGPHVIGGPGGLRELCEAARPGIIKYLDPGGPVPYLAPITIGRIHWISEEKELAYPLAVARAHAAELIARASATGIGLWEGINEPPIWNGADYIARLCQYEIERARLLRAAGLGSVVLNLNVGWPQELADGSIDWAPFRDLMLSLGPGDYLGLHEYWYPSGPLAAESRLHRAGRLFRCHYEVPIVVTECGVDFGGGENDGWRAQGLSPAQYAVQIGQYRDLVGNDRRVRGATVFTVGHNPPWGNFDLMPDWPAFVEVMKPGAAPPPPPPPSPGGDTMKLTDYPVPAGNNAFGWHWLPQLADARPEAETRVQLEAMRRGGATWIKLITSPGGDIAWERGCGRLGACEMTFCLALELGFGVVVRLFNSWRPPYWTGAVEANLGHLMALAEGKRFYVEAANEIDAEAGRPITLAEALDICRGIAEFVDEVWRVGQGQIIPVFPSFGYGGPGYNWFQLCHDIGRGDILDKCAVAVHNYASANRLYEPWDPDFIAGTPVRDDEWDPYPWRWAGRTREQVDAKRRDNAARRALLTTDQELMDAYAAGWFTYKWALLQLDALGHTETPLLLTETGTRVGEMKEWEPRVDPALHAARTRGMANAARGERRILGSMHWLWIGKSFAPTDYTWEDQCCHSPIWDRQWNETMPAGEYAQIVTPGRLPIIDELEAAPVPPGRTTGGDFPPEPPPPGPDPDPPEPETPVVYEPADVMTRYGLQIVPAEVTPGQAYWRIVYVEHYAPEKNNGMQNLFCDVLDEAGHRVYGAQILINWPGASAVATVDKPANEPGTNCPLWKYQVVSASCMWGGLDSDRIEGVHTGHPDEAVGNTLFHHSFEVRWQKVTAPDAPPPEPPEEPPEEPPPPEELPIDTEDIRNAAWNAAGLPWNPTAALQRYAREHGLGAPLTDEFTINNAVVVQGFVSKILWCRVGDTDRIYQVEW